MYVCVIFVVVCGCVFWGANLIGGTFFSCRCVVVCSNSVVPVLYSQQYVVCIKCKYHSTRPATSALSMSLPHQRR